MRLYYSKDLAVRAAPVSVYSKQDAHRSVDAVRSVRGIRGWLCIDLGLDPVEVT